MTTGYISPADFRLMTGLSTDEWSDTSLSLMINQATATIDELTNRTWQGVQVATNQYYDGDGTDKLQLPVSDLINVTALAIDDDDDGTYTTVSVNSASNTSGIGVNWYNWGAVTLSDEAEITLFTEGRKTVKISYTYGNASPTDTIINLCKMMVQQMMNYDVAREERIDFLIKKLKADVPF